MNEREALYVTLSDWWDRRDEWWRPLDETGHPFWYAPVSHGWQLRAHPDSLEAAREDWNEDLNGVRCTDYGDFYKVEDDDMPVGEFRVERRTWCVEGVL